MADDEKTRQDRIAALEAELRELRSDAGGEDRPLTLREIRALSKEQVEAEWQRIQKSLAAADDATAETSRGAGADARPTLAGPDRIANAYAEKAQTGGEAE